METKSESTTVWEENRKDDAERGAAIHIDGDGQPRPSIDLSTIQADVKAVDGSAPLKLAKDGHVSIHSSESTVYIADTGSPADCLDSAAFRQPRRPAELVILEETCHSHHHWLRSIFNGLPSRSKHQLLLPQAAEWQKSPNEINQANNVSVLMM